MENNLVVKLFDIWKQEGGYIQLLYDRKLVAVLMLDKIDMSKISLATRKDGEYCLYNNGALIYFNSYRKVDK